MRAPDADLVVSAHFRDSFAEDDGTETMIHEYALRARFDPLGETVLAVGATALALPWSECASASASAATIRGARSRDLRDLVRRELVGTSTCTHLNDVLRALAPIPHLVRGLPDDHRSNT